MHAACFGAISGLLTIAALKGIGEPPRERGPSPGQVIQTPIKADEEVLLFPTFAARADQGAAWKAQIRGWIFEPETDSVRRGAALALFRKFLGLADDTQVSAIFDQRARWFLVDNERGKRVPVRVGDTLQALNPSNANGHFEQIVRFTADTRAASGLRWIEVEAVTARSDSRRFVGRVLLLDAEGVSVISDIDDTVKITGVTDRKKLLSSTFLCEFEAVPGMAEVYVAWAEQGVSFHYVSASPWQLYSPLASFLETASFPAGTFHLKSVRWKDSSAAALLASSMDYKLGQIEALLAGMPKRRFVLVGDSGELDPEIYGRVARQHSGRIAHIYIRDVTGESRQAERYADAFAGLPSSSWTVFRDPAEMSLRLP